MSVCGHCGLDVGSRPYAGKRDYPSATTIAGAYDDGKSRSFAWAASLITATAAVHHPDQWEGLGVDGCNEEKDGLCPACRWLRSEFDRRWNAKANLGSHIHHLLLSWAQGDEIDVDAASEPHIDAAEKFLLDAEPTWIEVERTVLYDSPRSHGYRGQLDWIAEINCPVCPPGARCKWLGDWKSGRFYPTSQTLQMAAYRYARHLTRWEGKDEITEGPVPTVAHAGVCLLGADGTYQLIELPANGDAHSTFLRMRDAWGWHKQMTKWERERVLPLTNGEAA